MYRPSKPSCVAFLPPALALCALTGTAQVTIRVPADQATIQAGIAVANAGDRVLVAPGTYVENLDFLGKAITVESEQGPAVTQVDGGGQRPVVQFVHAEPRTARLRGFTLRNGRGGGNGEGGGVRIENASPTVEDNVIRDNFGCAFGAGIAIEGGAPLIRNNQILNNRQSGCSGGWGGGIGMLGGGQAEIRGNLIRDNVWLSNSGGGLGINGGGTAVIEGNVFQANRAGGNDGGAVDMINVQAPLLVHNLFLGNRAGSRGGAIHFTVPAGNRGPYVVHNTFVDNAAFEGGAIHSDGFHSQALIAGNVIVADAGQTGIHAGNFTTTVPQVRHNDVFAAPAARYTGNLTDQTGLNGNIAADPLFVARALGDFRLRYGSPCIDAGDNSVAGLPALDFEGDPRVLEGNGDPGVVVDLGRDEFSAVQRLGGGCPGSGAFVPGMATAGGVPLRGNAAFEFRLNGALGGTDAVLLLGISASDWAGTPLPLHLAPLGLPLCFLRTSVDVCLPTLTSGQGPGQGSASVVVPVPDTLDLRGVPVFAQWWVVDPGPAAVPAALSAALALRLL